MANLPQAPFLNTQNDEIRLLELDSENLHLQTFLLGQAPPYITLSYAWEEETDNLVQIPTTITIHIRDQAIQKTLRPNVCLFLERAKQHLPRGTYLWIDAICINQEDLLERSHQVGLMKRIYSSAMLTIVWLGESSDGTFDMSYLQLPRLTDGDPQVLFPPWSSDSDKPSVEEYNSWIAEHGPRYKLSDPRITDSEKQHNLWVALDAMCRRKYWERLWVVQEFALSRRVCIWIGQNLLELKDFVHAIYKVVCLEFSDQRYRWDQAFAKAKSFAPVFIPALDLCNARCNPTYGTDSPPNFETTFNNFTNGRRCADDHDTVYALLSLCCEPIVPDYSKPLSVLFWEILELPVNQDCVKLGQQLYLGMSLHIGVKRPESVDMNTLRFRCIYEDWQISDIARSEFDFPDDNLRTYSFFKIEPDGTRSDQLHLVTTCPFEPSTTKIRLIRGSVILLLLSEKPEAGTDQHEEFLGVALFMNSVRRYVFPSQRPSRLAYDVNAVDLLLDLCNAAFKSSVPRGHGHGHDLGHVKNDKILLSGRGLDLAIRCRSYETALNFGESELQRLELVNT